METHSLEVTHGSTGSLEETHGLVAGLEVTHGLGSGGDPRPGHGLGGDPVGRGSPPKVVVVFFYLSHDTHFRWI